jgi:hypothetical protein
MKRILFGIFVLVMFSAAIPNARGDGFLYSGGVFTTINNPAALPGSTSLSGINDAGQIVGTSSLVNS